MDSRILSFTKLALEGLPLPMPGQRIVYHDASKQAVGLQLRVTNTTKTFFVQKRINGVPQRITLGRFPEVTIEQARKQAAKILGQIAEGVNPRDERKKQKLELKTLKGVLDDYLITRKELRPRTKHDMLKFLRSACPDWLDQPLNKITPDMVVNRHKEHGEQRSKAGANLTMRYLRALFNFAMAQYQSEEGKSLIEINPVEKLSQTKAWFRVARRQTVIKAHELGAWLKAVQTLPKVDFRDYFLLVLLTGLRKEEALKLCWADVDLDQKTFIIREPKNHIDHTLPMSDFILGIFQRRKSVAMSEYVFADVKGRVISNFRHAIAAIKQASGIDFCIHDLRRTFATVAESLDIPAYALKRLLNHADGGDVTAGYIVANVERLREPMQKITDFVLAKVEMKGLERISNFTKYRELYDVN